MTKKKQSPVSPLTMQQAWDEITKEVQCAQSEECTHGHPLDDVDEINVKRAREYHARELQRSWDYANRMHSPLLKLRCLYFQNWLHYGVNPVVDYANHPHVATIATLVNDELAVQLRETREEMVSGISAIADGESGGSDIAKWVLWALTQCSPKYSRYHVIDVVIVQLMKALRYDEGKGNKEAFSILTEFWHALFQ